MHDIYFRIKKTDTKDISYVFEENGLLEMTVPRESRDDEINEFFKNLGSKKIKELADEQKKYKETFRTKIKDRIKEYRKEFDLPFTIDLQVRNKTNKLNDCHVDVHGTQFEGKMQLWSILQFVSYEIVDKIVRCTVYMMALDYEDITSKIKGVTSSSLRISTEIKLVSKETYEVPEKLKYHIPLPQDDIKKIQADYEKAAKQFHAEIKANPIICI